MAWMVVRGLEAVPVMCFLFAFLLYSGETCTEVVISDKKVPLGRLTSADVMAKAKEACSALGCSETPIKIDTEVWTPGHPSGSVYQAKCDKNLYSGNDHACGKFVPGSCTVVFKGSITTLEARDALIELLATAADLNKTLPYKEISPIDDKDKGWGFGAAVSAYPYRIWYCTYWFANANLRLFNDCEFAPEFPIKAMPRFIKAQHLLVSYLSIFCLCDFGDPPQ